MELVASNCSINERYLYAGIPKQSTGGAFIYIDITKFQSIWILKKKSHVEW